MILICTFSVKNRSRISRISWNLGNKNWLRPHVPTWKTFRMCGNSFIDKPMLDRNIMKCSILIVSKLAIRNIWICSIQGWGRWRHSSIKKRSICAKWLRPRRKKLQHSIMSCRSYRWSMGISLIQNICYANCCILKEIHTKFGNWFRKMLVIPTSSKYFNSKRRAMELITVWNNTFLRGDR